MTACPAWCINIAHPTHTADIADLDGAEITLTQDGDQPPTVRVYVHGNGDLTLIDLTPSAAADMALIIDAVDGYDDSATQPLVDALLKASSLLNAEADR